MANWNHGKGGSTWQAQMALNLRREMNFVLAPTRLVVRRVPTVMSKFMELGEGADFKAAAPAALEADMSATLNYKVGEEALGALASDVLEAEARLRALEERVSAPRRGQQH